MKNILSVSEAIDFIGNNEIVYASSSFTRKGLNHVLQLTYTGNAVYRVKLMKHTEETIETSILYRGYDLERAIMVHNDVTE